MLATGLRAARWIRPCRDGRVRASEDGGTVQAAIRKADVEGRVTLRIPDLGVKAYLPDGVGDLRGADRGRPRPR